MGFILMISGIAIVLASLAVLAGLGLRFAFVLTGVAIEALGLGLIAYGYKSVHSAPRARRSTR